MADGLVLGEALAPACALASVPVALLLGEVLLGELAEALPLGELAEALLLGAFAEALPLGEVADALALEGELDAPIFDALPLPQSPFTFTSCPTWAERSSLLLSLATLPFFSCSTNWPLLFWMQPLRLRPLFVVVVVVVVWLVVVCELVAGLALWSGEVDCDDGFVADGLADWSGVVDCDDGLVADGLADWSGDGVEDGELALGFCGLGLLGFDCAEAAKANMPSIASVQTIFRIVSIDSFARFESSFG